MTAAGPGRWCAATRGLLIGAIVAASVSATAAGSAWGGTSGPDLAARRAHIPPTTRVHKLRIADLGHRTVRVKLFGQKGFPVRRIAPWSLRLRTKGPDLHSRWSRHRRFKVVGDVNGDGFADARARFRVSLKKRVAAGHSHAEVIGIVGARRHRGHSRRARATALRASSSATSSSGTWTSFSASTELVTSDTASDYCSVGTDGYYVRCAFTTSFADSTPVDLATLVDDLNDDLSDAGYDFEVASSDSVQVEVFGGAGADGSDPTKCRYGTWAYGGDGGGRGYAQSAQTVAALEAIGSSGQLYAYVGQDGPSDENGGSSSMLLGQSILDVSDVQDPAGETFVGIAGGGGGGGSYASYSAYDTGCYNGHSGGDGGTAVATSTASVAAAGQDGHDGKDGEGGSDSTSTADDGGQPGVGGFSVDDDGTDNGWAGSSITLDDWSHGSGGDSGSDGGGGGGFGGGGHGNKDDRNYSGGGGGGSWALQDSVAPDSTFQVGQDGYDEPGVILTFETSPTS